MLFISFCLTVYSGQILCDDFSQTWWFRKFFFEFIYRSFSSTHTLTHFHALFWGRKKIVFYRFRMWIEQKMKFLFLWIVKIQKKLPLIYWFLCSINWICFTLWNFFQFNFNRFFFVVDFFSIIVHFKSCWNLSSENFSFQLYRFFLEIVLAHKYFLTFFLLQNCFFHIG